MDVIEPSYIQEWINLTKKKIIREVVAHYTKKTNIPKIFKEEGLSFRLTEISQFEDKLEGKCYRDFYNIALEDLVKERILTNLEYKFLHAINPSEVRFLHAVNGLNTYEPLRPECYVGCFTRELDSSSMKNIYLKNDERAGICFTLKTDTIDNHMSQIQGVYKLNVIPVMYGRDVVEEIKTCISGIKTIFPDGDMFVKNAIPMIRHELSHIQYISKEEKYRYENECRMVVVVPNESFNIELPSRFTRDKGGLYIKILKHAVRDIFLINLDSTDRKKYHDILYSRGYEKLIRNYDNSEVS